MADFRVDVGFFGHIKTKRLRKRAGLESGCLLIVGHCTFNNADGGGDGGGSEDENGFIRGE